MEITEKNEKFKVLGLAVGITALVIILVSYSKINKDINKTLKKIEVHAISEHSLKFYPTSKLQITLTSDSINRISYLSGLDETDKLMLDFYIESSYFKNAYFGKLNSLDEVIVLESYIPGCSGLSAGIVNVSIIPIKNFQLNKVISFNSFYHGIEGINNSGSNLFITILSYKGINLADETPIYCSNTFSLDEKLNLNWIKDNGCVSPTNAQFSLNCDCDNLKTPFVN